MTRKYSNDWVFFHFLAGDSTEQLAYSRGRKSLPRNWDSVWTLLQPLGDCPGKGILCLELSCLLRSPLKVQPCPQVVLCSDGSGRCARKVRNLSWAVALGTAFQRICCRFSFCCLDRDKVYLPIVWSLWLCLRWVSGAPVIHREISQRMVNCVVGIW